jgi:hypothetical protein
MLSELNDRPIKPVDVKNLKTNEIHKKAIELRVFLDAKKNRSFPSMKYMYGNPKKFAVTLPILQLSMQNLNI